jgi:uncharacterized protein (UPF0248 family)
MQPIQQLLNRIRWDPQFRTGAFTLGYDDRIAGKETVVAVTSITLDASTRSFSLSDDDGVTIRIPLHRVRTVYKDGVPIWQRPQRPRNRG